jgi:hypothetical protein
MAKLKEFCLFCLALFLVSIVPLTFAGCKKKGPAGSTVRGRVMLDGSMLPYGQVEFWRDEKPVGTAPIRQGKYEINNLTPGEVTVVVTTDMERVNGGMMGLFKDSKRPGMMDPSNMPKDKNMFEGKSREEIEKMMEIMKKGKKDKSGPPMGGGGPPMGGGGPPMAGRPPQGGGAPQTGGRQTGGQPPPGHEFEASMTPEMRKHYKKVADKYGTPEKSELRYTVVKGEQEHEITISVK